MRQGGFIQFIIIAIILLAFIFLTPIPYYQFKFQNAYQSGSCLPGQVCSREGINFYQPLWKLFVKTEKWITYTDETYGFEIEYPDFLEVRYFQGEDYFHLVAFEGRSTEYTPFSVEILPSDNKSPVETFKSRVSKSSKISVVSETNVNYKGLPAKIIKYSTRTKKGDIETTHLIINNEDYNYIISANSKTYDQIVSTFKFIK